jgi:hypothetical protein
MIGLLGCAQGTLSTAAGSQPVLSAWYRSGDDGDRERMDVFLSTSQVDCRIDPPDSNDPEEILEHQDELTQAFLREGARAALLRLYRYRVDDWRGHFPLSEQSVGAELDDLNPYVCQAAWYAVNEAAVEDQDGLEVTYELVDVEYAASVPEPGFAEVRVSAEQVVGSFQLDAYDVSGKWRAKPCAGNDTIFEYMATVLPLLADFGLGIEIPEEEVEEEE